WMTFDLPHHLAQCGFACIEECGAGRWHRCDESDGCRGNEGDRARRGHPTNQPRDERCGESRDRPDGRHHDECCDGNAPVEDVPTCLVGTCRRRLKTDPLSTAEN